LELIDKFAVLVIDIDPAVAEIADQYVAGELTEARRRQRHAPRRIERSARGKAPQQMSVGVEDIDEAKMRARDIVMLGRILLGIGDKEVAVDIVDAVRRIARGQVGIGELAVDIGGVARVGYGAVEQHGSKGAVIDVDRAGPEVGGEEIAAMYIDAEDQTLVDAPLLGPTCELSTTMEAVAASAPFQPTIVPSSVSYTKLAAALSAGTTKPDVPFQKIPVGAEVPLELLSPRVGVGKGIVTCGSAAIGAPVPSTRNERPVL
jgi:hypothetical protein